MAAPTRLRPARDVAQRLPAAAAALVPSPLLPPPARPQQASFGPARRPQLLPPPSALVLSVQGAGRGDGPFFSGQQTQPEQPEPASSSRQQDKERPLVRVQLSVHYRVHSRQMLCVGGSQIPFGWSFLSIAKVPMTWNQGDIWTTELLLPAGQRIEYKYVILEEQDWTKLENEDSEGLVEVSYRSGSEPGRPPDIQVIQKQMAIVAWQPGPNRVVQVPNEAELASLSAGEVVERVPARPSSSRVVEAESRPRKPDPYEGTWEILSLSGDGQPFLDRHDVWGWSPGSSSRPAGMRGFRFDS